MKMQFKNFLRKIEKIRTYEKNIKIPRKIKQFHRKNQKFQEQQNSVNSAKKLKITYGIKM